MKNKRLTKRNNKNTGYYYPKCFEKCDGDGASEKCDDCELTRSVCEKLGEYEALEEQGLLLRLPCKVGDAFWELNNNLGNPCVYPRIAHSLQHCVYALEKLGKKTFLTQYEAEEKLRKLKGKRKLKDCEPGSTVTIAGEQWQVLEHLDNGGTFCIKKDLLDVERYRAFDTNSCNNWKKSSLRAYLNGEYLKELLEKLQTDNDIILDTTQDLTTDDGLKDYGTSTDKVTLLTCEQYRKYRHLFNKLDDWWWLITADSTINHHARLVSTDGSLYGSRAFHGYFGVRSVCTFNSFVDVEEV